MSRSIASFVMRVGTAIAVLLLNFPQHASAKSTGESFVERVEKIGNLAPGIFSHGSRTTDGDVNVLLRHIPRNEEDRRFAARVLVDRLTCGGNHAHHVRLGVVTALGASAIPALSGALRKGGAQRCGAMLAAKNMDAAAAVRLVPELGNLAASPDPVASYSSRASELLGLFCKSDSQARLGLLSAVRGKPAKCANSTREEACLEAFTTSMRSLIDCIPAVDPKEVTRFIPDLGMLAMSSNPATSRSKDAAYRLGELCMHDPGARRELLRVVGRRPIACAKTKYDYDPCMDAIMTAVESLQGCGSLEETERGALIALRAHVQSKGSGLTGHNRMLSGIDRRLRPARVRARPAKSAQPEISVVK